MNSKFKNVKQLLTESISKTKIQFDLAIAALIHNDISLANYIFEMEKEIAILTEDIFIYNSLGIRSPNDAKDLLPYFFIAKSINDISKQSANLAEIVTQSKNPLNETSKLKQSIKEFVDRIEIPSSSPLIGKNEDFLDLQERLGIDIMALKRSNQIFLGNDYEFQGYDVLYLRGPKTNVKIFQLFLEGKINSIEEVRSELQEPNDEQVIDLNPIEKTLGRLINFTSLIIDLGLYVQINHEKSYYKAINDFENLIDRGFLELSNHVLDYYKNEKLRKPESYAFLRMGMELEILADSIFGLALRTNKNRVLEALDLMDDVLEESEEDIDVIVIDQLSPYLNKSIWEAEIETQYSGNVFDVLTLTRKGKVIPYPDSSTRLQSGDSLMIKIYNDSYELDED